MAIKYPITGELGCKVVYYGPAASGKTTNIKYVYDRLDPKARGQLIAPTDGPDRTLFFDLLPVDIGVRGGPRARFHLYTVPGQAAHLESRKLVLRGVDGVVFVADSHPQRSAANRDSLEDLAENLAAIGLDLKDIPIVMQFNKRDLEGAAPVRELDMDLNAHGWESFEAIAIQGRGVLETLKAITRLVLAAQQSA